MGRRKLIASMLLIGPVLAACGDPGPRGRPDPADVALDSVQFACGDWSPSEPDVALGLFDVFWGQEGSEDPGTGPRPEHRAAVLAAGGTVVHEFHVPMIRAILPPERVPDLDANLVTGVQDATAFRVDVFVGYGRAVTPEDIAFFESLGGVVTRRYANIHLFSGHVPNAAIAPLRARSEVAYVEGIGVGCRQ